MPNYGSFVPDALRESDNAAYATLGKTLYLPPTVDPNDVISDLVPLLLDGDHAIIVTLDYVIFNWYKRNLTHFSYVLDERVSISLFDVNSYHIHIAHRLTITLNYTAYPKGQVTTMESKHEMSGISCCALNSIT